MNERASLAGWRPMRHRRRPADLLDELNRRIDDRDFRIGPSYFMQPAVHQSLMGWSGPGGPRSCRCSRSTTTARHVDIDARYGLDAIVRAGPSDRLDDRSDSRPARS